METLDNFCRVFLAQKKNLCYWYSCWQNLSPVGAGEAGNGKVGVLFEIPIHNPGASEDAQTVFLTSPGRNPLKSLDSEK
jgi:hypothetical protein